MLKLRRCYWIDRPKTKTSTSMEKALEPFARCMPALLFAGVESDILYTLICASH